MRTSIRLLLFLIVRIDISSQIRTSDRPACLWWRCTLVDYQLEEFEVHRVVHVSFISAAFGILFEWSGKTSASARQLCAKSRSPVILPTGARIIYQIKLSLPSPTSCRLFVLASSSMPFDERATAKTVVVLGGAYAGES
jgi:hypothetical protein